MFKAFFLKLLCDASNYSTDEPITYNPSVDERIKAMDDVRKLRLKSNKTPEEWKQQRELTAYLNALALPV